MSRVSKDPWRLLVERHARRGLAMGRMGITNAIMLLQSIFLYMLSSNDSTNAVSKMSFYVDITYRILLCIWFLYTGCNYAWWWSDGLNNVNHLPQNIAHSCRPWRRRGITKFKHSSWKCINKQQSIYSFFRRCQPPWTVSETE